MATPYSIFNTRSLTDPNLPVRDSVTISGAVTTYSDMWSGESGDGYGLTLGTTGTLTGTFTLWMTDNPFPRLDSDQDWVQDTAFTPTNPAGAGVLFRDDAANAKAYRKRIKFVSTAGTGTVQGRVTTPRFVF